MSKATVTRLFIGSLIAAGAGAIAAIVAVWLAIDNGVFVMSGQDIVAVQGGARALVLLGLGIVGGLAIAGGVIGGLIAWIGALLNTAQLERKTWFLALLLTGIFNFGFIAMIAYVLAGPDGTAAAGRQPAPASIPA
ncbi:MAG TPA: hypothetical protein VFR14_12425 [Candidatus Limnocylindrales bacterium]|nr:hypothetical protein [Candidatus Limnocylindrales bacterium]